MNNVNFQAKNQVSFCGFKENLTKLETLNAQKENIAKQIDKMGIEIPEAVRRAARSPRELEEYLKTLAAKDTAGAAKLVEDLGKFDAMAFPELPTRSLGEQQETAMRKAMLDPEFQAKLSQILGKK